MQDELHTGIGRLQDKVQLLLKKYDELEQENTELKDQIEKLKSENLLLTEKITNTTNTARQNQLVMNLDTMPTDNRRVKEEIEAAVTKIEKCIDWLQKN